MRFIEEFLEFRAKSRDGGGGIEGLIVWPARFDALQAAVNRCLTEREEREDHVRKLYADTEKNMT